MGLDITAYSRLSDPISKEQFDSMTDDEKDDFYDTGVLIYDNPDFPDRANDLACGYKSYNQYHGFQAGSYSGYNQWRSWLARVAGYQNDEDFWSNAPEGCAFYELIDFSDCEGALGTAVCKKLANDFAQHQHIVDQMVQQSKQHEIIEYYAVKYADWMRAFQLASDNGAVCLH